jgi:hypothetical protein
VYFGARARIVREILRKREVSVWTETLKLILEELMSMDSSRPDYLGIIPVLRSLELPPPPCIPQNSVRNAKYSGLVQVKTTTFPQRQKTFGGTGQLSASR